MSDRIYTTGDSNAIDNFVTVCEAIGGVLTKTNFANGNQKSYDHVKFFNLEEISISNLYDLYCLSIGMLTQHNCCFIRARIKDEAKTQHVVRKCNGDEATLILQNQNWVPLDIDWSYPATGNIKEDAQTAILALPAIFHGVDYFAVASASYGFKPGIRMRLFFWCQYPVSNLDIKKCLADHKKIADPAIYNPIQPIYTSEPIGVNPVKNRIVWKKSLFDKPLLITISDHQNIRGAAEIWYTKNRAEMNKVKHLERIGMLTHGERHPGLITEGLPLGKLIGQGHFERETIIDEVMDLLDDQWTGKRDPKKDRETITWAIDKGIASMEEKNNMSDREGNV